ncbi:hypothetical protein HaLaN_21543 [Haematococcus lacustris]|uniref:Uncharacterized protein n=1 Tax=Haematococcus lacustris TaxID=44745 RepID=A0A699ZPJ5_HAELA|nr:hypothetical protein HaLaN_21543 [Haematococcus lacustris]
MLVMLNENLHDFMLSPCAPLKSRTPRGGGRPSSLTADGLSGGCPASSAPAAASALAGAASATPTAAVPTVSTAASDPLAAAPAACRTACGNAVLLLQRKHYLAAANPPPE